MYKSKSGFTIVELISVVTILLILATIVVVSYTGIQERAYNALVVTGVKEYLAGIRLYQAVNHGEYPHTLREDQGYSIAMTCLGTGYSGGTCGTVTDITVYEDSQFNTQIKTVMANSPKISSTNVPVVLESFTGGVYGIDITSLEHSSTGKARTIQYALLGSNADCILPKAWGYNVSTNPATTACEIVLEETPAI